MISPFLLSSLKVPYALPPDLLSNPPTPTSWPWRSPVLGPSAPLCRVKACRFPSVLVTRPTSLARNCRSFSKKRFWGADNRHQKGRIVSWQRQLFYFVSLLQLQFKRASDQVSRVYHNHNGLPPVNTTIVKRKLKGSLERRLDGVLLGQSR